MKNTLITLALILYSILTYAQKSNSDDCIRFRENTNWLNRFEYAKTKKEKISLIKKKIETDRISNEIEKIERNLEKKVDTIRLHYWPERDDPCYCEILFLLLYKTNDISNISKSNVAFLQINSDNINTILNEIDEKNIDTIEKTTEIGYGEKSNCGGTIKLITKDKKLKKLIKLSNKLRNSSPQSL